MGKRLKKLLLCMTILLSVTVFNIFQVTAVDVNKNCSLTLNECLSGLNVHLYRVTSVSKDGTYAYTDEEKQQAKSWLSSHGYPPTRAGAEQAYQDYMDGKIDVPEADAYMGKNQKSLILKQEQSLWLNCFTKIY